MKLPQTGGCQCGKIRYRITEEPQLVYTCHCTDCQRLTSSAFSMGIVRPRAGFRPQRRRAASATTDRRQRAHQYPIGLPRMRHLDLRHAEGWCAPGPGRHPG